MSEEEELFAENPFAITRLQDPCLTKQCCDKVQANYDRIESWLTACEQNQRISKAKALRKDMSKIKQAQRMMAADLKLIQHGLEQHAQMMQDFCQVTIERMNYYMIHNQGKQQQFKTVPWRSGREKTRYLNELEKSKQEAAQKGRAKKKARIESMLKGQYKMK